MTGNDKNKKKEKQEGELEFKKVTLKLIREMILEYKETGLAPIVVESTENDIKMLMIIDSMHNGGSVWINGFDVKGKFVCINENYVVKINYMETTQTHFDEYNNYMKQAIVFHQQSRKLKEQYGLFG